ncbi:MAG: SDR family NAD(P)-dependent oxidoreductase [Actinobacteria bacterium]|nr:SDR family NAD(P)-dependent oxidoreductase [Actinomycetota bacterium]
MDHAWTAEDIPEQGGRVAVVTGANTGLGLETARELARHGATVVLAVRNLDKGRTAIADIEGSVPGAQVELVQLDLASLASVREAAAELLERHDRLDLLVNNAGVMVTPRQATADGFELQIGTNHLGHFAWTGLLLDRLLGRVGSRVVTVSSAAHRLPARLGFDDLTVGGRYDRASAYGRSKLANLLFTYALERRLDAAGRETIALAAHPGSSETELVRYIPGASSVFRPVVRLVTQSAAMGALPTLRAATDPGATGGQYYGPDGFQELHGHPVTVPSSRRSRDRSLQEQLWARSEELTGVTYPV